MTLTELVVALLLLLGLSGCADARTPQEEAARQLCLASAELKADAEADELCHKAGHGWTNCPHRQAIMGELAEEQMKCR